MNFTTFKRAALIVACGMQVLMATAQDHQDQDETPYLVKTFPRDQIKQLRSQTSGGNIHVSGQTTGDAKVMVFVGPITAAVT
jgi:hypothetical protein